MTTSPSILTIPTDTTTVRNLRRTVLPNGLIVLTERMEHLRSVAMGVWVKSGSRYEAAEINGISHFVEHMLFKGTRSRSAQHIAREMDAIGGNLDAFTGKETICFSVKALSNHVPIGLDVLSDLVLNPTFADVDIERERGVILEEIKIDEDNPDVLVHEIFTQNFWKDQPLGKPILGTTKTVSGLQQPTLFGYHSDRFRAGNMVFSAAGNLDHDQFVASVAEKFDSAPAGGENISFQSAQVSAPIILRNKRSLEQVQICLGVPSPPITDEKSLRDVDPEHGAGRRDELAAVSDHSRRARDGLPRSTPIWSPYSDTGAMCVYAGTSADKTLEMLDLVMAEFRALKETLLTEEELHRAKEQVKGNILLGLESSGSRMSNLARQEMYFKHFFSVEEVLERLDAVTADQVQTMAQKLFVSERIAVTLLGRLDGLKLHRSRLVC